jgi:hypothetical protein
MAHYKNKLRKVSHKKNNIFFFCEIADIYIYHNLEKNNLSIKIKIFPFSNKQF